MIDLSTLVTLLVTLATLAHLGLSWFSSTIDDRAETIAVRRGVSFEEALDTAEVLVVRLHYVVSGLLVIATALLLYQLTL